jgi:hypothetical protein
MVHVAGHFRRHRTIIFVPHYDMADCVLPPNNDPSSDLFSSVDELLVRSSDRRAPSSSTVKHIDTKVINQLDIKRHQ